MSAASELWISELPFDFMTLITYTCREQSRFTPHYTPAPPPRLPIPTLTCFWVFGTNGLCVTDNTNICAAIARIHHFYLRQFVCPSKQNIFMFMAGSSCSLSTSRCPKANPVLIYIRSLRKKTFLTKWKPLQWGHRGAAPSSPSARRTQSIRAQMIIQLRPHRLSGDATKWLSQSCGSGFRSLMGALACMSARVGRIESCCDSGASWLETQIWGEPEGQGCA